MSRMRIAIFGGHGLLGSELVQVLRPQHEVGIFSRREHLDFGNRRDIISFMKRWRPDVSINCIAMADVDECQRDPVRAWTLNADAVQVLAAEAASGKSRLVQISTDYVFGDNTDAAAYVESDSPAPMQTYGETKLAGETHALSLPGSLVVRLPLLYAARGPDGHWARIACQTLSEGREVSMDDHYRRQPAFVPDIARAIASLVLAGTSGVVHLAPPEAITRFRWGQVVAATLGVPAHLVRALDATAHTSRPRASRLASARLRPDWELMPRSAMAAAPQFVEAVTRRIG